MNDAMDVAVIGSFVMALTTRLPRMPDAGESLIADLLDVGPGGKGSNLAVAAARQGARVGLVAKIGADMFGDVAAKMYADEGIDTAYVVRTPDAQTGVALIYLEHSGQNRIGIYPGANAALTAHEVERIASAPGFAHARVIAAQLEIGDDAVRAAARLGAAHGKTFLLNPAPARPLPADVLRLVDILTPNEGESRVLAGIPASAAISHAEVGRRLLALGPRTVIITLGEQGCLIVQPGAEPVHIPAFKVDAIDTVGAGDAFNGGLAVALAEGRPLVDAARWACATAALAVMHVGVIPGLPRRADVERLLARQTL